MRGKYRILLSGGDSGRQNLSSKKIKNCPLVNQTCIIYNKGGSDLIKSMHNELKRGTKAAIERGSYRNPSSPLVKFPPTRYILYKF